MKVTLFLRCNLPALKLPSKCDRCGQPFAVEHALCCEKGRLIAARHSNLKFKLANLLGDALLQSYVKIEPILLCSLDKNNADRLVGSMSARNA